jgi:L-fucose isomerase-like protein
MNLGIAAHDWTPSALNRRSFVRLGALGLAGCALRWDARLSADQSQPPAWDPSMPLLNPARKLTVQPVLLYSLPTPRAESSWKSWGGVQTAQQLDEELNRIEAELAALAARAEFPLEIRSVAKVSSQEEAARLKELGQDVTLVYACTGGGERLRSCLAASHDSLIFVRHRSGPIYYWYEALSSRYLDAKEPNGNLPANVPGTHVDDVVVDDYSEMLWRLRALAAVKNLKSTRIVALGGVWGKYAGDAPQYARDRFGLQVEEVSYDDLAVRIERARTDPALNAAAERWADQYLAMPGTALHTERQFVVKAFMLYRLFRELMQEKDAAAFTIKSCMGTIIPMSKTTACLSLSLLNDEGWLAFCESDFVIIPAGILLRYISGKPVFLHNSTFPHAGMVTCAHCTAPRRMDGRRYEPAQIVTHYESEYGAAPKVDMPLGQKLTFIDPEYTTGRWVGFAGAVQANPAYAACRSQQDVAIEGQWRKLLPEARDSHWVTVYGDYLKEAGFAARKLGLRWDNLSSV